MLAGVSRDAFIVESERARCTICGVDWLNRLLGTKSDASGSAPPQTRRVTVNDPLVIHSPRIGFLNLLGSSARQILEEDKAALAPLFASSQDSETDPPVCDVLVIYANVQSDGSVVGYSGGLRDIIRKANCPIAVVASESEAKGYDHLFSQSSVGVVVRMMSPTILTLPNMYPKISPFTGTSLASGFPP
jgi:hypothetical protein